MDKTTAVTVRHLVNSLAQIELWAKAVRKALASLDPNTVLHLTPDEEKQWEGAYAPLKTTRECPPPE